MKLNVLASLAISAALVSTSMNVSADGGFYGSLRIGLSYLDLDDGLDSELNFENYASRLGFTGETDIDSGLTAFGKVEFGVDTSFRDNGDGAFSTRHAYIGLKGDFGSLLVGQTFHTWYNTIIAPVDQPWWGSCNGCLSYTFFSENGLTYTNSFGEVVTSATLYMRPEAGNSFQDDVDGIEVGASFPVGNMTLGLGFQDWDNGTEPTLGMVISGNLSDINYAANITKQDAANSGDVDTTGLDLFLSKGNYYLDVGGIDYSETLIGATVGYTHTLGRNTITWFELQGVNSGLDNADTSIAARAAIKYDWN
ncbi:MAG: porin [Gammaproteobacteria bacterium]|nr:porin [Gammaproteobacteria bacterium]